MEDTDLIILGRIAVIWGQIIFHLDMILLSLMAKTSVEMLKEYPTRSLDRKLKDLSRELSNPKNATIRALLLPVHAAIDRLASDRNVIFHGLWGYQLDRPNNTWMSISKSHTRDQPFPLSDLREFHERLVQASAIVDAAAHGTLFAAVGQLPQNRNKRQFWGDGPPNPNDPPPPRAMPR